MIRSLAAFREEHKAVRILEVERVLATNTQSRCFGYGRYDLPYRCRKDATYIVATIGSKVGKFYCGECLEPALRKLLIAPPEEYPERERVRLERLRKDEAHAARERRRAAHAGCAGWTENDPDNLCHRPPVARARYANSYTYDAQKQLVPVAPVAGKPYCARHIVRFRRRGAVIEPLDAVESPRVAV